MNEGGGGGGRRQATACLLKYCGIAVHSRTTCVIMYHLFVTHAAIWKTLQNSLGGPFDWLAQLGLQTDVIGIVMAFISEINY